MLSVSGWSIKTLCRDHRYTQLVVVLLLVVVGWELLANAALARTGYGCGNCVQTKMLHPQGISMMLWGLATLEYSPKQALLDKATVHIKRHINEFADKPQVCG